MFIVDVIGLFVFIFDVFGVDVGVEGLFLCLVLLVC